MNLRSYKRFLKNLERRALQCVPLTRYFYLEVKMAVVVYVSSFL